MLLYENKKAKLLNILKLGLNPFKKFVSTGEIEEELGVVQSRKPLLDTILNKIDVKGENIILPIIGDTGTGKTFMYWSIKKALYYYNTVYISLENVYRKFNYNIYSEFIEEMGVKVLRSITGELCNDWGSNERKFGFFHIADIDKVRKKAYSAMSDYFKDEKVLNDIINAITIHQLDAYKKLEAENWLLGEPMDYKDLARLNLSHDLKNKAYAFSLLKILIENSKLGSVLFIDDFERIISLIKTTDEDEEDEDDIYSSSWLYGRGEDSPDKIAAQKIFDKIIDLLEIKGLKIIFTLKSNETLEEIKRMLGEKRSKFAEVYQEPLFLQDFNEYDFFQFYKKNMKIYLENINYKEILNEDPKSYYPLDEKVLKNVYNKTQGNPREIIKLLIKVFNEIIYSDDSLDDIKQRYYD